MDGNLVMAAMFLEDGPEDLAYEKPPCLECGAMTEEEAETMCGCGGDKDYCHGCYLWGA